MKKNVLIMERSLMICKTLKYGIVDLGHHAYYSLTGREGIIHLLKGHYNVVILGFEMADISSRDLLQIIRARDDIPIIVISSSDQLQDKVEALRLGADDYLVNPVALEEVAARIEALCRRCEASKQETQKSSVLFCHGFTVDTNYKTAYVDGKRLDLTRKEFELLYYMIANKGRVLSKEQIYQFVWKEEPYNAENSVMCHIYNLRKKIEKNPAAPRYIQTVWGFGYRFLKD